MNFCWKHSSQDAYKTTKGQGRNKANKIKETWGIWDFPRMDKNSINHVYRPAEFAVNSTVEKIQILIFLKVMSPARSVWSKHTITTLTCTFRKLSAIIIAATEDENQYKLLTSILIIISEDFTLSSFPTGTCGHYPNTPPTIKRRTCRTLVPASAAATTAWLRTINNNSIRYPAPSVVPEFGLQPHDVPTNITTPLSIQHFTTQS